MLIWPCRKAFEIDELPLSEKVRIFRQLTLDVRFYRDNFFQLNDLISTLAIRYPDDKDVVELYAQHLINAGELEQALTSTSCIWLTSLPSWTITVR